MSEAAEIKVFEVFREALGVEVPSPDADVIEIGLLDSLALVTLVVELVQCRAISIP